MASDLFCGIADVVQDVGVVTIGKPLDANERLIASAPDGRWIGITGKERRFKAIWSFSDERGWLFVPYSREAVEDVMSWGMPYVRNGEPTEGARATAFSGNRMFRETLDSENWEERDADLHNFIKEFCLECALFEMTWSWGSWRLYPGRMDVNHLFKLADPVVARINTENAD